MLLSPVYLHIPDGFLSVVVSAFFWAASIIMVWTAISRTNKTLGEKQIPVMGVMAAFIFAAQMLNFPVAGGTSGHFLGGALAAIVLGPWAGILVMTAVVAVQGLMFQDGGLLAMGTNIFNMGIITAVIGFGLFRSTVHGSKTIRMAVAGASAWITTMAAALLTSLQLWLSGTTRLEIVIPAMLGVHALIGVGEALITIAALSFIDRTRPDLLNAEVTTSSGGPGWVIAGIIISLMAVVLSPFASTNPDGLERVAKDFGFLSSGQSAPFEILPDYSLPILGNPGISTVVAGAIGILVVFGIIILLGRSIKRR